MVERNVGLVRYYVAGHFKNIFSDHFQDMVQEGYLGLMEAVYRYRRKKGKFSTYAMWWIRAYVLVYIVRLQFERNLLSPFFDNMEEGEYPEEDMIDANRISSMLDALKGRCTDTEYQILSWKYCDGYSVREIVNETGLGEIKVRSILTQTIRKIRGDCANLVMM